MRRRLMRAPKKAPATVAKASSLGATVMVPKQSIDGRGFFAVLVDPQGAGFSIYEETARAS